MGPDGRLAKQFFKSNCKADTESSSLVRDLGRAGDNKFVGGKHKKVGARQDLKLETAHGGWGCLVARQAKQEYADAPLISNVISLTACNGDTCSRPGSPFDPLQASSLRYSARGHLCAHRLAWKGRRSSDVAIPPRLTPDRGQTAHPLIHSSIGEGGSHTQTSCRPAVMRTQRLASRSSVRFAAMPHAYPPHHHNWPLQIEVLSISIPRVLPFPDLAARP